MALTVGAPPPLPAGWGSSPYAYVFVVLVSHVQLFKAHRKQFFFIDIYRFGVLTARTDA